MEANNSPPIDHLMQLARKILASTEIISQYLHEHNLPSPSFEEDAPETLPQELESARSDVFEATQELGQLVLGPKETLLLKARDNISSLHALSAFKLAQAVPSKGEVSFSDIAHVSGVNERNVQRIIQHLATDHIFRESRRGFVSHTAASKLIAKDPVFSDFLDVYFGEISPAIHQTVKAMQTWPDSQDPVHNGFSLFTGGETLFSYLEKRPERASKFANSMITFASGLGWDTKYLLQSFDWAALADGTVVDVGGSTGTTMAAVISQYPRLRCIVQDSPSVIEKRSILAEHLGNRISFMPHDFFTEQPVKGANAYFFRMVFHDWSDEDCVRILRALLPALKPGSRIWLNEWCLPEPGSNMLWSEKKRARTMDINMLSLFNSGERDGDDWRRLFREADSGFAFEEIYKPAGSCLSAIKAIWRRSE